MEYSIRIATPSRRGQVVTREDLPRAYEDLRGSDPSGTDSPTITWNDGADWSGSESGVLIVGVNDAWSMITLLTDGTEHRLTVSNDDEKVDVVMEGESFELPRKVLAPRELGLEVLLKAEDVPALLTEYTWEER